MKKGFALLMAVWMAFSCMAFSAFAAAPAAVLKFTAPEAETASIDAFEWYQAENGEYYIFIPSYIGGNELKVWFDAPETVAFDGVQIRSGSVVALQEDGVAAVDGAELRYHALHSSGVAAVFIETESGSMEAVHADKSYKEAGSILILNEKGKAEYDGKLDYIKGRGNASWQNVKKPYNIKLDKKTNLFKMGKSKKWCLIANYDDPTLARNAMMYAAAQEIGLAYSPLYQPCDVYLNGEYHGAYLLTTKVEVASARVDINNLDDVNEEIAQLVYDDEDFDMDTLAQCGVYGKYAGLLENTAKWVDVPAAPEDYDAVDITGGYILEMEIANRYSGELSGFVTSRSQPFTLKSPEYASEAQINYIRDYYQRFEDAVFSDTDENAQGEHYTDLADLDSLTKYYLISEWSSNMDTGLTSTYFYKDVNGKLFAGPVWDYDIAFGNNDSNRFGINYVQPDRFTVCFGRQYRNTIFGTMDVMEKPTVYNQLNQKESFVSAARAMWDSTVAPVLFDWANNKFAAYEARVRDSAVMNAVRWNLYHTLNPDEVRNVFDTQAVGMGEYLSTRTVFLNDNLGTVPQQTVKTGIFARLWKSALTGINDLFEKTIVLLKLENR